MEKRLTILLTTISLLALPATAQENTLEMNCSTYDDNPPGPGESTSCLLEGFPSDFNWKNYTHDWSTSMGQVTQESVESAQISLPEQYSNSELMVKAEITDASGETYVAEKNMGLEEISDEGENQSYQTPVEDPVNNETQGEKILPQPEVYCPSEVNSGEKVRCNVTYSSDIAQPSYEWNVKGQGDVDGDLKHGIYVAPEVQEEETEEVSLSLYSSSETNSASEKISVVPKSSDNSDQESSNDERLNRQSQKIEEQQETIRSQREKLRQRESTIEDLRSTVQDLRNQLNNLEEEDSESRENYEENGSEERQETEDAGGNDSKETKDEQVREEEQEAFNESGSDTQNSSERENDQDSSEVEFEEAEESSDELENENTTEGSSNQDSSGLIGALTSLFG